MDGHDDGRIKVTKGNMIIVGYKITRSKLAYCKKVEMLKHNSIYFLIGNIYYLCRSSW